MEFVFVVLATEPFLEHHYFCLTDIYCQGPSSDRICVEDLGAAVGPPWLGTELGAAVGPPWLGTEAPDHQ